MKQGKEIVNEVLEYLGLKAPTFANEIGVLYSRVQNVQQGKAKKISLDLANKICAVYPEINKSYLLKGEGEMLNTGGARTISVSHSPNANVAGNDINMTTPAQMATDAIVNDNAISKADLFAVIRHLQETNDRHLATIETLQQANARLNSVLLELVAKWKEGENAEAIKNTLMKFDSWS